MTQSIPIGMSVTLDQNVTYALPAKPVYLQTVQGGTQHSPDGVNWFSTASGTVLASKFLRSTIVGSTVLLLSADKAAGSETVSGSGSFQNFIAVGANPAQSDSIRLTGNDTGIKFRHTNGLDYNIIRADNARGTVIGTGAFPLYIDNPNVFFGYQNPAAQITIGPNPAQSGAIRLANNQAINARNAANNSDHRLIALTASNTIALGQGHIFELGSAVLQFIEKAPISAPPIDSANLWLQDNGAGKTQLMVQFNTGGPIQLAIQP